MKTPVWVLAGVAVLAIGASGCQLARRVESKARGQVREAVLKVEHRLGKEEPEGRSKIHEATTSENGFTGEVQFRVSRAGEQPETVRYTIEGGKVRYDILDKDGHATSSVVADLPARTAFAILPSSHEVIDIAPVTGPGDPPLSLDESVFLRRPDKTDKVAGQVCETWEMSTEQHDVEACVTSDMSWFDLVPQWTADHMQPRWSQELTRDRFFPLRLIIRDKRGLEQARIEAVSVQARPVDEAIFSAPPHAKVATAMPGGLLPSAT